METPFFQFARPWFLMGLPILFLLSLYLYRRRKQDSLPYSSTSFFPTESTFKVRCLPLPFWFLSLALFFLLVAMAGPEKGKHVREVTSEGVDIMLAIDTSGSMKALDFELEGGQTNRLDVVKRVVDDFISKREQDRIGMVIFGDDAYTQSPLTLDKNIIRQFLKKVRIGIAGDGTAIGSGMATALKRLKSSHAKSKIIILLTDGRNNAGEIAPETASGIAKEMGVKVYTIGVGSQGPVPYPEETPFGTRKIYAQLDLDESILRKIAEDTGGAYFRATDTEELKNIYGQIDDLEKTIVKVNEYSEVNPLFQPFLILALLLLLAREFLREGWLITVP